MVGERLKSWSDGIGENNGGGRVKGREEDQAGNE